MMIDDVDDYPAGEDGDYYSALNMTEDDDDGGGGGGDHERLTFKRYHTRLIMAVFPDIAQVMELDEWSWDMVPDLPSLDNNDTMEPIVVYRAVPPPLWMYITLCILSLIFFASVAFMVAISLHYFGKINLTKWKYWSKWAGRLPRRAGVGGDDDGGGGGNPPGGGGGGRPTATDWTNLGTTPTVTTGTTGGKTQAGTVKTAEVKVKRKKGRPKGAKNKNPRKAKRPATLTTTGTTTTGTTTRTPTTPKTKRAKKAPNPKTKGSTFKSLSAQGTMLRKSPPPGGDPPM